MKITQDCYCTLRGIACRGSKFDRFWGKTWLAVLVSTGSVYDYQKIKSTMIHTSQPMDVESGGRMILDVVGARPVLRFKLAQEATDEDGVRSSTPTTGRFQSQCH